MLSRQFNLVINLKLCVILQFTSLIFSSSHDYPIFIFSVPKCGTHLAIKAARLLTNRNPICSSTIIKNNMVSLSHAMFRSCNSNNIIWGHILYNQTNCNFLAHKKFKGLFIYRDPRDQLISHIFWQQKMDRKAIDNYSKDINELISHFIKDGNFFYTHVAPGTLEHYNPVAPIGISTYYKLFLPWKNNPSFYAIKFENLIGPDGGGSKELQIKELHNIVKHLNLRNISPQKMENIARQLFGESYTFREGKIGSWKQYFTEEHKAEFKKYAGQLLIDLGYETDLNW